MSAPLPFHNYQSPNNCPKSLLYNSGKIFFLRIYELEFLAKVVIYYLYICTILVLVFCKRSLYASPYRLDSFADNCNSLRSPRNHPNQHFAGSPCDQPLHLRHQRHAYQYRKLDSAATGREPPHRLQLGKQRLARRN